MGVRRGWRRRSMNPVWTGWLLSNDVVRQGGLPLPPGEIRERDGHAAARNRLFRQGRDGAAGDGIVNVPIRHVAGAQRSHQSFPVHRGNGAPAAVSAQGGLSGFGFIALQEGMLELFEIRLGLGELEGGSPILCVNELLYLTSPRSPLAATSFRSEERRVGNECSLR